MTTSFRVDALNRREDVARFLSVVRRRLPGSLAVRSASCRQMRRSFRMAHRLATTTGSPFRLSASAGAQAKQSPRFRLYVVPPAADAGGAIPQPAWPFIRCKAGAKNERDDVSDRREHGPCPARARRVPTAPGPGGRCPAGLRDLRLAWRTSRPERCYPLGFQVTMPPRARSQRHPVPKPSALVAQTVTAKRHPRSRRCIHRHLRQGHDGQVPLPGGDAALDLEDGPGSGTPHA